MLNNPQITQRGIAVTKIKSRAEEQRRSFFGLFSVEKRRFFISPRPCVSARVKKILLKK